MGMGCRIAAAVWAVVEVWAGGGNMMGGGCGGMGMGGGCGGGMGGGGMGGGGCMGGDQMGMGGGGTGPQRNQRGGNNNFRPY